MCIIHEPYQPFQLLFLKSVIFLPSHKMANTALDTQKNPIQKKYIFLFCRLFEWKFMVRRTSFVRFVDHQVHKICNIFFSFAFSVVRSGIEIFPQRASVWCVWCLCDAPMRSGTIQSKNMNASSQKQWKIVGLVYYYKQYIRHDFELHNLVQCIHVYIFYK